MLLRSAASAAAAVAGPSAAMHACKASARVTAGPAAPMAQFHLLFKQMVAAAQPPAAAWHTAGRRVRCRTATMQPCLDGARGWQRLLLPQSAWHPQQPHMAKARCFGTAVAHSPSASWRAWPAWQPLLRSGPPQLPPAAAWPRYDSWALWVDRTSGLLLSSLVNALNTAGGKLPAALGLLLVDMVHNSPMLGGGCRADALSLPPPAGLHAQPSVGFVGGVSALATQQGAHKTAAKSGDNPTGMLQQLLHAPHRVRAAAAAAWTSLGGAWAGSGAALAAGARLIWLGVLWLPALITAAPVMWWGVGRPAWLILLRVSLEASGPAFIKWGQWAATRHDIFPADVCAALEKLHTSAPAHSFRYTCAALRKSFELPPSELFEWVEDEPIACGSIGQVHRGRLSAQGAALTGCRTGDLVAIKVRHPGVSEAIERDFETMVWLVHAAASLLPSIAALRLEDTLKQFAAPLHEQVDLSREADNLRRFNENFRRARAVSFPLPLYPLVSEDVLVESFERGRHISHYIGPAGRSSPICARLAELGSGTMLQMMLVDNLIHSDLHPGNILVRLEPPHGLLGLAYRALTRAADPAGPVMRTLRTALERMDARRAPQAAAASVSVTAATQTQTGSSGGGGGDQPAAAADDAEAAAGVDITGMAAPVVRKLASLQASLAGVAAGWLQPHIVLLDVGMATELSSEDQANMVGLFRCFAALDGAGVASWVLRFSGQEQACPAPGAFVADMAATFETLKATIAAHKAAEARWQEHQAARASERARAAAAAASAASAAAAAAADADKHDGGSVTTPTVPDVPMPEHFDSGAEALATVLELVRVHGVSLPGHICAVVVTTLVLEGWSNQLAPEHSVLNQVQGMFSPSLYSWHDRMDGVVDTVMDRGDTALSMA